MKTLVFNTSMPRAGSELLQVILSQNPRIYGSATSPLLEYMFGARQNYGLAEVRAQDPEVMKDAFLSMNMAMAQGYYETITDKPVVCDKNRGWSHYYEWVAQWNPEPKMICMVRDLRSIIASFERIYQANRHHPECIDNPAQIQNMTQDQRVNHWLTTQPVGLALNRTADLLQRGVSKNILFVRYEDLCADPQDTMDKVYDYLGEEPFTHDFNNIVKTVKEDDSHFGIFGQHNVKPAITSPKERDWEDVYKADISNLIKKSNEWYAYEFGYRD